MKVGLGVVGEGVANSDSPEDEEFTLGDDSGLSLTAGRGIRGEPAIFEDRLPVNQVAGLDQLERVCCSSRLESLRTADVIGLPYIILERWTELLLGSLEEFLVPVPRWQSNDETRRS